MGKSNGKTQTETRDLDLEHELAAGDEDQSSETAAGAPEPASESPRAEAELQKVKAERDTLLDRLARMQAEFENARRRSAKEQQDFRDFAIVDAIKSLLPVIDNMERALQAKSESGEFRTGVELIYKQLQDVLAKLGVQPIVAKGQPFDPHVHEAIEMVETPDAPDHEVLEEWQRGYKIKDRLLRPAMVKVARNPGK
ncbi:MAG TPA: nucleotide exchange factor GrpE [Candidatus Sulfotelmatobacter sp.]|nr:nucleotide exchange factor GrpE [Candidatus Sulfotelmatobacter sp.]